MKSYLEGKKLNNIEKNKAQKDGLELGSELEELAKVGWEKIDKTDLELRLKWYGMFWRPKSPGKFMLRLRIPNGVLNNLQLKVIASIVARYGDEGSSDITTRQNLQLRGVLINDLPEILKRLKEANLETIQSGFDNPRNVTGNPLAGIDPEEILDTRPYTLKLQNFLTNNGNGNAEFSNLPRKWNTAVAGSYDNFLLHNDLIFHPVLNKGVMGFGVWVGGILSSQLNDYAVPLNAWVNPDQICNLTGVILSIWRNHGERDKRNKGRFRFYLNKVGIENFRKMVEEKFGELSEDPGSIFSKKPRTFFGVNPQKQSGLFYAGLHVPVGRLTAERIQDLAYLSSAYGSGEIRLTEDQNIIIVNINGDNIRKFKADPLLKTFPLDPDPISAGTVSCTGSTYCSFALTNTKDQAQKVSRELASELDVPKELKIHWTGCPNSCGQAYMGAIGLTGTKTRNSDGEMTEAYNISIGGKQGPVNRIGELKYKSIPKSDIKDVLKKILIENHFAVPKKTSKPIFLNQIKRIVNWIKATNKSILSR